VSYRILLVEDERDAREAKGRQGVHRSDDGGDLDVDTHRARDAR
jgi:hypothetical protein